MIIFSMSVKPKVSIPKRVSEALKLPAIVMAGCKFAVSIPKRVSEALKPGLE